ncbi:MAG: 6-pyruvoyl-tetrahydropterin synthase-related protein, partial [Candidatus Levybacteria bacterium]|nr:6-pyruvoyl-tetrahydropterin synthase-related protein [Candidatus Levybacteria bacterium]
MVKKILPVAIVFFFAFLAGFSLLHSGLPPTHDGEYHVIRFYEFDKVLREGNLYPRWAPDLNNGFGVPLFNYVYPFPNYMASFFHLFGFSFIDSFKLNMFFATIAGALFFYLWTKRFWGQQGAVVSSIFYTFSPYHFVDIYIRGSVGEVWALAFFPASLWSITELVKRNDKKFIIPSGIFISLIVFSHNILALMFFVFFLSYSLMLFFQSKDKKNSFLIIMLTIFLGLFLSSIFWFPALFETKYVVGLQVYNVAQNFPELFQLLIPSWGSGFSSGNLQNQMSFQIGIANLAAVVVAFGATPFFIRKKDKNLQYLIFFLVWFILVFFLMLGTSKFIWDKVPLMKYFQFPWRFLSLEILFSSFLAGIFSIFRFSRIISVLAIAVVFILGYWYTKPAYYHQRDDNYYVTRSNFIDGTNSPGNSFNTLWMEKGLKKDKEKLKLVWGKADIKKVSIDSTFYRFDVNANKDSRFVANVAYFPGWEVYVDN